MSMSDENEFLQSLQAADDLAGKGTAAPRATTEPPVGFGSRRKRGVSNVPFNHSILKETAAGFYDIAIRHDWTMNRTLTEALKLLAMADKKGEL
ncbi:hypothetical protein [Cognatiyoonia sp. IB215182]|uniref:hypothetical protein n=1 Tax=Cognatiyoonia sp. IB215182 TaxID=3097353 RepID=UPI002A130249|nr:hypothetical protein [Cognatiyoonia sp. IB215182]MDX8355303.1 hypothetical protein [Cognatiyoonia sp. IB215182]